MLLGVISLTDIVLNVPAAATLGACLLGLFAATAGWSQTAVAEGGSVQPGGGG
jgi:hypothetical protein